jgi:high-affinity Fe2+/Pb2+ permease
MDSGRTTIPQSRLASASEIVVGTAIKLLCSFTAGFLVIYPMFDYEVSAVDNIGMTVCFTVIGMVVSYVVRRLFNNSGENYEKT